MPSSAVLSLLAFDGAHHNSDLKHSPIFPQSVPILSVHFRYSPLRAALTCDLPQGVKLKKYRRIEVNALRRRVTIVSGEWRAGEAFEAQTAEPVDEVSLNDRDLCEPVEPGSPEGQLILVDAVRVLERRLSPEARATICSGRRALLINDLLRSIYNFIPRVLRFQRKEEGNPAEKQSADD